MPCLRLSPSAGSGICLMGSLLELLYFAVPPAIARFHWTCPKGQLHTMGVLDTLVQQVIPYHQVHHSNVAWRTHTIVGIVFNVIFTNEP